MGIAFIFYYTMEKVLLKKHVIIPEIILDDDGRYIDGKVEEVDHDIYGVFKIGPVSINLDPESWTFYKSVKELNENLWTKFTEADAFDYDKMIKVKEEAYKDFIKNAWKNKK